MDTDATVPGGTVHTGTDTESSEEQADSGREAAAAEAADEAVTDGASREEARVIYQGRLAQGDDPGAYDDEISTPGPGDYATSAAYESAQAADDGLVGWEGDGRPEGINYPPGHTAVLDAAQRDSAPADPGPCARCDQPYAAHTPLLRLCRDSSGETYLIPAEIDGQQAAIDALADWLAAIQQTVSAALWSLAKGESAEAIGPDTAADLRIALDRFAPTSLAHAHPEMPELADAPAWAVAESPEGSVWLRLPTPAEPALPWVLVRAGADVDPVQGRAINWSHLSLDEKDAVVVSIPATRMLASPPPSPADDEAVASLLVHITAAASALLRDRLAGSRAGTVAALREIASLTDEALAAAGAASAVPAAPARNSAKAIGAAILEAALAGNTNVPVGTVLGLGGRRFTFSPDFAEDSAPWHYAGGGDAAEDPMPSWSTSADLVGAGAEVIAVPVPVAKMSPEPAAETPAVPPGIPCIGIAAGDLEPTAVELDAARADFADANDLAAVFASQSGFLSAGSSLARAIAAGGAVEVARLVRYMRAVERAADWRMGQILPPQGGNTDPAAETTADNRQPEPTLSKVDPDSPAGKVAAQLTEQLAGLVGRWSIEKHTGGLLASPAYGADVLLVDGQVDHFRAVRDRIPDATLTARACGALTHVSLDLVRDGVTARVAMVAMRGDDTDVMLRTWLAELGVEVTG